MEKGPLLHISEYLDVIPLTFVHIPKERRQKLDSLLEKCIFVEYKDGVKGYKLWNPTIRTVVYSRDVILREIGSTSKTKEVKKVKEPKNLEFDLRNEIHD